MAKYTAAQAKAAQKYLSQFKEIKLRMYELERLEIQKAAAAANKSMNEYILDKILSKEVRDLAARDAAREKKKVQEKEK